MAFKLGRIAFFVIRFGCESNNKLLFDLQIRSRLYSIVFSFMGSLLFVIRFTNNEPSYVTRFWYEYRPNTRRLRNIQMVKLIFVQACCLQAKKNKKKIASAKLIFLLDVVYKLKGVEISRDERGRSSSL